MAICEIIFLSIYLTKKYSSLKTFQNINSANIHFSQTNHFFKKTKNIFMLRIVGFVVNNNIRTFLFKQREVTW